MITPPPVLADWLRDEFAITTTDLETEPLAVRLLVLLKADIEVTYGDWPDEEFADLTTALAGTLSERQDDGIHHYVSATRASSQDMLAELAAVVRRTR